MLPTALLGFLAMLLVGGPAAAAESYDAGVARIQLPKIQRLIDLTTAAADAEDWGLACSSSRQLSMLLGWNLLGLQEIQPGRPWLEARHFYAQKYMPLLCKAARITGAY